MQISNMNGNGNPLRELMGAHVVHHDAAAGCLACPARSANPSSLSALRKKGAFTPMAAARKTNRASHRLS